MNLSLTKYILSLSLSLLLFTFHSFSQAQPVKIRGAVKGIVTDTTGKQQLLSDATVSATPDADTNAAQFVVTSKKGAFQVRNLNPGKYHLLVSFEGYEHLSRTFFISADSPTTIDLGTLYMQRSNEEME